tara:strand:- start:1122 stop:1373 length:252 start_codon:yes stop_codon:yes gene_type:complete
MPSGFYVNELGNCGICQKPMRPLYKNTDWKNRAYHVTCFKKIINDMHNYNTIAYSKYGVEKKVANMPITEAKKQKSFTITFDD